MDTPEGSGSGTGSAGGVTTAPEEVEVTPGDEGGSLEVSWQQTDPVTQDFTVFQVDPAAETEVHNGLTSYLATGLEAGVDVCFQVATGTGDQIGEKSAEKCAAPESGPTPTDTTTTPTDPTDPVLEPGQWIIVVSQYPQDDSLRDEEEVEAEAEALPDDPGSGYVDATADVWGQLSRDYWLVYIGPFATEDDARARCQDNGGNIDCLASLGPTPVPEGVTTPPSTTSPPP